MRMRTLMGIEDVNTDQLIGTAPPDTEHRVVVQLNAAVAALVLAIAIPAIFVEPLAAVLAAAFLLGWTQLGGY